MKKITVLLAAFAMMITMVAFSAVAFADEPANPDQDWAGGSIYVGTGIIDNDSNRTEMQYPGGKWLSWGSISWWTGASGELYNADGQLVGSYTGEKEHTFKNLKEGEYTVKIPWAIDGYLHMFESVNTSDLYTEPVISITITPEKPSANIRVVAEYKAYDYKTITDIGTFKQGKGVSENGKEKDYFPDTGENGARNWSFEKTGSAGTTTQFSTHSGIYYKDSANQYNMNFLEVPLLSDEEKAAGYKFAGWQLVGDEDPDKIYSDVEALGLKITKDTVFKAVWEYPTHVVSFRTSKSKGTIDPATDAAASVYEQSVEFSNKKLGDEVSIPEVTAKNGYKFLGWYTDLTEETLTEAEIKALVVDRDITLFAKYQAPYEVLPEDTKHTVTFKTNRTQGTLDPKSDEIASLYQYEVNDGAKPTAIPAVTPKEGYEFVGWYSDPTKDILTEDEIKALIVRKDVVFFAEYKSSAAVSPDDTGTVTPATDNTDSSVQSAYDTPKDDEATVSPTSSGKSSSVKSVYTTPGSTQYGGATAKTVSTRTGDDLRIVLYSALMLIAGTAMMLIVRRKIHAKR